jgi:hypothetical protein
MIAAGTPTAIAPSRILATAPYCTRGEQIDGLHQEGGRSPAVPPGFFSPVIALKAVVYLISRIQTTPQFIRLADFDKFAPARGFHRRDGLGVGVERLERQGLFRRYAHQQQAKGVGYREADFLQSRGGFPLGAFIDAGANDRIASHGVNLL